MVRWSIRSALPAAPIRSVRPSNSLISPILLLHLPSHRVSMLSRSFTFSVVPSFSPIITDQTGWTDAEPIPSATELFSQHRFLSFEYQRRSLALSPVVFFSQNQTVLWVIVSRAYPSASFSNHPFFCFSYFQKGVSAPAVLVSPGPPADPQPAAFLPATLPFQTAPVHPFFQLPSVPSPPPKSPPPLNQSLGLVQGPQSRRPSGSTPLSRLLNLPPPESIHHLPSFSTIRVRFSYSRTFRTPPASRPPYAGGALFPSSFPSLEQVNLTLDWGQFPRSTGSTTVNTIKFGKP